MRVHFACVTDQKVGYRDALASIKSNLVWHTVNSTVVIPQPVLVFKRNPTLVTHVLSKESRNYAYLFLKELYKTEQ